MRRANKLMTQNRSNRSIVFFAMICGLLTSGCSQQLEDFVRLARGASSNSDAMTISKTVDVEEGDSAQISVAFNEPLTVARSLTYTLIAKTAQPGTHYTDQSGSLQFSVGDTQTSLTIPTIEVGLATASSRTFELKLRDEKGADIASSEVTIRPKTHLKRIASLKPYQPGTLNFIEMGAYVLFAKITATHGVELWKSDGTATGTALLKDICVGTCSSDVAGFVKIGSTAYFVAKESSSSTAYSIYKTDGSAVGTVKAFDLSQVTNSTNPAGERLVPFASCDTNGQNCQESRYLIATSSRVFFLSNNSADFPFQMRIYSSQGTIGTTVIMDADDDYPLKMLVFNDRVFYSREDDVGLWDGTTTGGNVRYRYTMGSNCGGNAQSNFLIGANLFFACYDYGTSDRVMARFDSTFASQGVRTGFLVASSGDGAVFSYYIKFAGMNYNLYRTDGASEVVIYSGSSYPVVIGSLGTQTVFYAGTDLYKTDGTVMGTTLIRAFPAGVFLSGLGAVGSTFYFSASLPSSAVWQSDLTAGGTFELQAPNATSLRGALKVKSTSNGLYFSATTAAEGRELYRINTSNALEQVTALRSGPANSPIGTIVSLSGLDWFTSVDETSSALYRVAPSPTALVKSALSGWNPGTAESVYSIASRGTDFIWTQASDAYAVVMNAFNALTGQRQVGGVDVTLTARSRIIGIHNDTVLVTGSLSGLQKGASMNMGTGLLSDLPGTNDYPYFNIFNSSPQSLSLPNGIVYIGNPSGNKAEPYFFNSTTGSTTLLNLVDYGISGSAPTLMGVVGNQAYFIAGAFGNYTLFKTDGTLGGTSDVFSSTTPPGFSYPASGAVTVGSKLFFSAETAASGYELWVTDGTGPGTQIVREIRAGAASSLSSTMVATELGGKLIFTAMDATNGQELWISDGTLAGTTLLKDICAGVCSSGPKYLNRIGNYVYFWTNADNPTPMSQTTSILWRTDGTPDGTTVVKDVRPFAVGEPMKTPLSLVFGVTDYSIASRPTSLWRFRPAVNSEPEMIPGYQGTSVSLLGVHNEWVVLTDTDASGAKSIYFAR